MGIRISASIGLILLFFTLFIGSGWIAKSVIASYFSTPTQHRINEQKEEIKDLENKLYQWQNYNNLENESEIKDKVKEELIKKTLYAIKQTYKYYREDNITKYVGEYIKPRKLTEKQKRDLNNFFDDYERYKLRNNLDGIVPRGKESAKIEIELVRPYQTILHNARQAGSIALEQAKQDFKFLKDFFDYKAVLIAVYLRTSWKIVFDPKKQVEQVGQEFYPKNIWLNQGEIALVYDYYVKLGKQLGQEIVEKIGDDDKNE